MSNPVIQEDLEYIVSSIGDWDQMYGKTVVIAGAGGFLPAYMAETLICLNDKGRGERVRVIGIVRNEDTARSRFAQLLGRDDFSLIVHDVNDPLTIPGRVDYIIHAASQASPKYYGSDPVGTLGANVLGTRNLLELAREKKVREFLYFSSGEVYGEVDSSRMPIREDCYGYLDPMNVRSCYAESKRMGETMCVSWSWQFGVPVKIARLFHTYGPGMRPDDGRVFADFVADIVGKRDIVMKSDGSAVRAFCYLADATVGLFTILLRGCNREAYNVGNDKCEISILELADMLVELFPERGLKVLPQLDDGAGIYLKSKVNRACPDITKLRSLGWEPHFSLEDGFEKTVRSYLT